MTKSYLLTSVARVPLYQVALTVRYHAIPIARASQPILERRCALKPKPLLSPTDNKGAEKAGAARHVHPFVSPETVAVGPQGATIGNAILHIGSFSTVVQAYNVPLAQPPSDLVNLFQTTLLLTAGATRNPPPARSAIQASLVTRHTSHKLYLTGDG